MSFFNQLKQLPFAKQRMREAQPIKLVLTRREYAELFDVPII
jgi:hypothetical protein